MMYELPPQAQGTPEQQLATMRDYLVRLAQSLEPVAQSAATTAAKQAVGKAQAQSVKEVKDQAAALKELIIKTADDIYLYADSKVEEYNQLYVAQSDFGTYTESVQSQIETTARGVVESYNYQDAITAAQNTADEAAAYMTDMNGQIRRGIITYNGEEHLGIAISENLEVSGTETRDGKTYNVIQSNQTFGLYTAQGWEFWINGVLRGYFSSEDSMLHVSNIVVEDTLQLGADWKITTTNGFGLRYIGG